MTIQAITVDENVNLTLSDEPIAIRIRFVNELDDPASASMKFLDPTLCYAVSSSCLLSDAPGPNALDVLVWPLSIKPPPTLLSSKRNSTDVAEKPNEWFDAVVDESRLPSIVVKMRGAEVTWRPGRALLQCEPEQTASLLKAIIDFNYFENELRKIESEIAAGWADLEVDKRLAYQVTPSDLECSEIVGRRIDQTLQRRIRHARIEPHLYAPNLQLTLAGQKVGEELREKANIEDRSETVDSQMEVFEHVYEMGSQRMGEFRDSRQGHTLEWVIIILLGSEVILLIADMLWQLET
ncbi:MAG: hypothetical protein NTW52_03195 [Planctomycetota bacterium]|nr:hypothetical protein [Planctomycetota bacterium]